MKQNYLLDKAFLKQLDQIPNKEVYAKIILLNWEEMPKYEFSGRITQGSINIDGASAVRRTCSFTMVTEQGVIESNYWGLENKFKLEVGVKNDINSKYPDICWFKQGIYIITSLNETLSTTAHTITLQGKDKICLINGDIGGNFTAKSTDLGVMEVEDRVKVELTKKTYEKNKYYIKESDDSYHLTSEDFNTDQTYYGDEIYATKVSLTIEEILKNMLNAYGKELPHNIIINDIDDYGLELLEYRGNQPLYLIKNTLSDVVENMTFDGAKIYYTDEECTKPIKLNAIKHYDYLITQVETEKDIVYVKVDKDIKSYTVIKLEYGDTAGYRKTDLTYPGDLIANLGESVVTILDKIKNTFSNFEYFYDIDGRFHFQKKKSSNTISWSPLKTDEDKGETYSEATMYSSAIVYNFEGNNQFTNVSYQPNITNIKNDFSIWGKRTSVNGSELPIHLRYAIQDKPTYYKKYAKNKNEVYDEYYTDDYELAEEWNREENKKDYRHKVDWREIIYQMAKDQYKWQHQDKDFLVNLQKQNPQCLNGITGYENFYIDVISFWRDVYDPEGSKTEFDPENHFNYKVTESPELLDFWMDFIDTNTELGKYSISRIGDRTKTENNDSVSAVYIRETPNILIITNDEYNELLEDRSSFMQLQGYTFIRVPDSFEQYFSISSQGLSAWDVFNDLLYENTAYNEQVTLTTFPIYYLEPNNRILVNVGEDKINGEYLLNKITVPLGHSGTGSLTASKAVDRIY